LARPAVSYQTLLTELSDAERAGALERFRVLRPCLEDGVSLASLAREHGLRLRTLQRWLHAYRQRGLSGLARKSRSDRGQRLVSAEYQQLIEGLALRCPPLSRAAVYREATLAAQAHGWKVPSYHTVYRVIQQLSPALVTLAHDGPKVYADRFELLYRREAGRSNEIWQADHTPLDLWILDERRSACPSVAHGCTRRLQPRSGRLCAQRARSVEHSDGAGHAPGDLAEGRPNSGPWRTILYTPGVVNTPRTIERDVGGLWRAVVGLARRAARQTNEEREIRPPDLVIVDEADRLKTAGLEQLRDLYDRRDIGLVLIGMPGLQKRLARYAQLYSRVGFVHQFQPLSGREFQNVVERQWVQLGLDSALADALDVDVLNTIARITGGNFRLIQRLFAQIERVLTINQLAAVTVEVVDAAREGLVVSAL
jgi:transposase-like protein